MWLKLARQKILKTHLSAVVGVVGRHTVSTMAKTKQTAKKSTGGRAPPGQLGRKAARATKSPRYSWHAQTIAYRKNGLRSNNPFYGDFFKVNARGDRVGPDEERGSTLANWSDHVKGFLVALRGPPGDTAWNDRFADVGILNMMAGAKVESGEPLMGPVDDTGRVVIRRLIVQSYKISEEGAEEEEYGILLSVAQNANSPDHVVNLFTSRFREPQMLAYPEEVHEQEAQQNDNNRAGFGFFKDLVLCVPTRERYTGYLTAVAREMYNEVDQLVRTFQETDWKRQGARMGKNFDLGARFRVGKTPTSLYSDPMEFVNFTLDNNGVDCVVGSLANAIAVDSLSHAKLFATVMDTKFANKKFSKLMDLKPILESESVRSIPEWKNWGLVKCLPRELLAGPPALELFSRRLDWVMDVYKGTNPLVVSLVDSEANESHVVAIVQQSGMRLVIDSVEMASLKLTKEALGWCAGGTGEIGGVAQVFEVRSRASQAKRVVSSVQGGSGSSKRPKRSGGDEGGSSGGGSSFQTVRGWGFGNWE